MTADCLTVQVIAAIARAGVLIVCAAGGVLSIFWGWKLYRDAVLSRTEGDASFGKYRIKLAAASPGVFFALFGMFVLWKLVQQPATIPVPKLPTMYEQESSAVHLRRQEQQAPGFLLTAGAKTRSGDNATDSSSSCLLSDNVVFFTGGALTPPIAKAALVAAIDNLSGNISGSAQTSDGGVQLSKADAIRVLQVMMNNIHD